MPTHRAFCARTRINWQIVCVLTGFIVIEAFLFYYHRFCLARGETDGIGYMARATGAVFQAHPFHGPGYSIAIRLMQISGLGPFSAAKIVSLGFAVLFLFVCWLILSTLSSSKEALLACVIISLNHIALVRGVTILSDMMAAGLFLSSLALLIVPKEVKMWHFACAGVVGGLAYLTRYVYIVVLLMPLLLVLLRPSNHRFGNLSAVIWFLLGFGLVTLPWFIFLFKVKGSPFWNENHLNIAFKMYRRGHGWNVFPSSEQYKGLTDVIFSDPVLFAKSWLRTVVVLPWKILDLIPRIGIVGGVGFFLWLRRIDWRGAVFLLINMLYGLVVCLVWIEDRFLLPLMPLAALIVVAGLSVIPEKIVPSGIRWFMEQLIRRIPVRTVVVSVCIVLLCVVSVRRIPIYFSDEAIEYKTAADWLAAAAPRDGSVMAAKPHIAFFSKLRWIYFRSYKLQDVQIEELPEVLEEIRPSYFIYDQRYGAAEFPQLEALLDPNSNPYPEILSSVVEVNYPKKLVIYEYKK